MNLGPEIFPQIHVADQPVQVIGMQSRSFAASVKLPPASFERPQDEVAFYVIHCFVITHDTGFQILLRFHQGLGKIFRTDMLEDPSTTARSMAF